MSNSTLTPPPAQDTAPPWQRWTLKQIALGTALVALVILACVLVISLRYVLLLLFLGIVLATALNPLFERLRGWGASRSLAAVTTFIVLFVVIGGILAVLVPFFVAQITLVVTDLPERYIAFRSSLVESPSRLVRDIALLLPQNPLASQPSDSEAIETTVSSLLPTFVRGSIAGALVLLLSYYWLYYRALAVQSVALLIPLNLRTEAVETWNLIETKIGAFVRGLAILGITIAIMSFIGYSLIGLPFALTIAILAGILEAVPYVGALVTMIIAGIVGLTVSPEKAILALIVANIVQFIEGSIVVPRAMDKTVGVRPVVTLLALAVFGELFGLLGALLAVPLAAAIQVLLDRYVLSAPAPEQLEIGGRDQIALLRYKTQDLAGDLRQQVRSKDIEPSAEADADEDELEALLVDLDNVLATAQGQTV